METLHATVKFIACALLAKEYILSPQCGLKMLQSAKLNRSPAILAPEPV